MIFVQYEFVWLMALVFCVYWGVRNRVAQNVVLAVASACFYGWVHPWFLMLLYTSAIIDFGVGLGIKNRPQYRQLFLAISLCGNLGMLGFFKYYNFFIENVRMAATSVGLTVNLSTLDIILPVGISFYTFQTLSYTIDVYKGKLEPRTNFLDYVVYVSFFPQLVAGPIERADHLLPQIEAERVWDFDRIQSGLSLALWGAFKKICLADTIAPYVDEIFMLENPSGLMVQTAVVGFGMQILADFSGYTDIARGTARMLGIHLVENFDRPYWSANTLEFWRRWHMSLSSWIADYVYIPLVRSGPPSGARVVGSLFFTFFLIGVWHGAAWHYILLGVYHGCFMVFYTFATPMIPRSLKELPGARTFAMVFHWWFVLWPGALLFREVSVERWWGHMQKNPFAATEDENIITSVLWTMAMMVGIPMGLYPWVRDTVVPKIKDKPWFFAVRTTAWTVMGWSIYIFYRLTSDDFIYFEF